MVSTVDAQPDDRGKSELWRVVTYVLPVILAVCLVLTLFIAVRGWEDDRAQLEFKQHASLATRSIERNLKTTIEPLHALQGLFYSSDHVNHDEFQTFAQRLIDAEASTRGLGFIRKIDHAEREQFEAEFSSQTSSIFAIKQLDESHTLIRATTRETYFPIVYLATSNPRQIAAGFDLGSNPIRLAALERARDNNMAVATEPLILVDADSGSYGCVVLLPIYTAPDPSTVDDRRESLIGFVGGTFRIHDIIDEAVPTSAWSAFNLSIVDHLASDTNERTAIFESRQGQSTAATTTFYPANTFRYEVKFASRAWQLQFSPTAAFMASQRSWSSWLVLGCGLIWCCLLILLLVHLHRRSRIIERRVEEQTAALSESHTLLEREIEQKTTVQKTLLQRDAQLRGLLANSPAAVHLKTLDGRYLMVNRAFAAKADQPIEALVNQTDHEIRPADIADQVRSLDREVIEQNRKIVVEETFDTEEGMQTFLSVRFPLHDADGNMIATAGIATDITQRKRTEQAIEETNRELERVNHELQEFVYCASHDLKSPLVTIQGFLNYLQQDREAGREDRFDTFVGYIEQATMRMRENIDDLLELSRVGRVESEPMVVDVGEFMQSLIANHKSAIAEQDCSITMGDHMPTLLIDQSRMIKMFDNLIVNALKYGCAGDERRIHIDAKVSESAIKLTVSDFGRGIPEHHRGKVFGVFQRLSADGDGSGIGLAIVKQAAESLDGKVEATSTEPPSDAFPDGRGTTICITLPTSMLAEDVIEVGEAGVRGEHYES